MVAVNLTDLFKYALYIEEHKKNHRYVIWC